MNLDTYARETSAAPARSVSDGRFVTVDTKTFAGIHLLIDLWDAHGLDDEKLIERAIRDSVKVAGASLLHIHLHRFTPSGGISGIANLAESHISLHTWPERGYAAIDLFMCGDTHPELAIPVLKRAFNASRAEVSALRRGELP
ncbi:MAG: S-adenosylmethionine decarboxylase proenzyme [Alphaproteobacteria bacterium MarineAlpha9_Bin7]|nr:MAG: S-adenosylmethionine decarboxylase proenzyme [Alphaproteobacteria bacterium MarineAlpha9_Bin7]